MGWGKKEGKREEGKKKNSHTLFISKVGLENRWTTSRQGMNMYLTIFEYMMHTYTVMRQNGLQLPHKVPKCTDISGFLEVHVIPLG